MHDLFYKIEKKFNKLKEKEILLLSILPGLLMGFVFYQYIYKTKIKEFKKKEKTIKVLKGQIVDLNSQKMIISSNIQEIKKLTNKIQRYNKKIISLVNKTKNNIYYLKTAKIFKINWVNILNDLNNYLSKSNLKSSNFVVYLNNHGEIKKQFDTGNRLKNNKKLDKNKDQKVYNLITSINKSLTKKLLLLVPKYYYYYEINTPNNMSDLLLFINKLFNDKKMKQIYFLTTPDIDTKALTKTNFAQNTKNKNLNSKKIKLLLIYFDIKK